MDYDFLQLIKKKENYVRFQPYVENKVLNKETQLIYNSISEYYKKFPDSHEINWEAFETWFCAFRTNQMTADAVSVYKDIFQKLKTVPASSGIDDVLRRFVTLDHLTQIANVVHRVRNNDSKAHIDQIADVCRKYDKELGRATTPSSMFVDQDLSSVARTVSEPGYNWRLNELNIALGPARKGDFIVIGARPEAGKTTFLASETSHMATQFTDERPVIWINNEERSDKVFFRVVQAALGLTSHDILTDPVGAMVKYTALMGGMKNRIRILSKDSGINSQSQMDRLFHEGNPALIIFDQLDKVGGYGNNEERDDLRLGRLYKWARDLAGEYGPVITASQCSASAEGMDYITMDMLRGSKTDKAAEADAVITIGNKLNDPNGEDTRYLYVPKNKLFGGTRSLEAERHGKFEVKLDAEHARYIGTR